MSLRAIARAVPRCAARITSTSTRSTVLRPALRTASRSSPITSQIPRCFSTSYARFDDASQELAAKLTQEIQLESEENSAPADSDSNIQHFLSQNSQWSLEDTEGEQEVLLKRSYEDEEITVSFSIADFNSPMMDGEEADEALMDDEDDIQSIQSAQSGGGNTKGAVNQGRTSGGNMKVAPEDSIAPADRDELRDAEDESDGQAAFPASVNVLIQRSGKGALRVNLVADNGVFTIQSVTHLDKALASSMSSTELFRHAPESLYTGPPFQQLDEEVQSLLEAYLDSRGINTALALFVPEYIDVKEQKEYLGWLSRVKEFVE